MKSLILLDGRRNHPWKTLILYYWQRSDLCYHSSNIIKKTVFALTWQWTKCVSIIINYNETTFTASRSAVQGTFKNISNISFPISYTFYLNTCFAPQDYYQQSSLLLLEQSASELFTKSKKISLPSNNAIGDTKVPIPANSDVATKAAPPETTEKLTNH